MDWEAESDELGGEVDRGNWEGFDRGGGCGSFSFLIWFFKERSGRIFRCGEVLHDVPMTIGHHLYTINIVEIKLFLFSNTIRTFYKHLF
jgi:hypothetical protein